MIICSVQGGNEFPMNIKPMDYVENVKAAVGLTTGLDPSTFELIYQKKPFDNLIRMDTYFLEPNCKIYVVSFF